MVFCGIIIARVPQRERTRGQKAIRSKGEAADSGRKEKEKEKKTNALSTFASVTKRKGKKKHVGEF